MAVPTPLEQAQALREALVSAIERLMPSAEVARPGTPGALQYHILNEQCVQKRPISYITVRHNIGESTFHRNRREAVSAVAHDLQTQEEQLQRDERITHRPPLAL